jgi:hypothetical protein
MGATASAVLSPAGSVVAINITSGGTGYTSSPQVVITKNDYQGEGAFAAAAIAYGSVTGITITNPGSAYTAIPTIQITGGLGADQRDLTLIKIAATYALRNALDNAQSISPKMESNFKWADDMIEQIQIGQATLNQYAPMRTVAADYRIVSSTFKTRG